MLTIFEQYALRAAAEPFVQQVQDAVRSKMITRRSRGLGEFQAPVTSSGKLADSVVMEFYDDGIRVYCEPYIDKLIFGQPPGEPIKITDIENWLIEKGLDYNPVTIAQNIFRYGSSIWQKHQGSNSGLLSDVNIDKELEVLQDKLSQALVDIVSDNFIKQMAA